MSDTFLASTTLRSRSLLLAFVAFAIAIAAPSAFAQSRQLSLADILIALRSKKAVIEEKNKILAEAVKMRGITFNMTPDIEKELGSTGAQKDLIDAIKLRTPAIAKVEPEPAPIVAKAVAPPPDYEFYKSRASASAEKNDLDGAVADLTKALEMKPTASAAYHERAQIYAKQGKSELAVADFDKALQNDSSSAASFVGRGTLREKLKDSVGAMADYRKALDLDPKNEIANAAFNRLMAEEAATEAKRKPEPAAVPPPVVTSVGVRTIAIGAMNNQAITLARPNYTQQDRRMGFQGKVTVLVTLDEKGEVTSAAASEGPKALRPAAEDAVKRSKFKPMLIEGQPAKVTGFLVFNFMATQ